MYILSKMQQAYTSADRIVIENLHSAKATCLHHFTKKVHTVYEKIYKSKYNRADLSKMTSHTHTVGCSSCVAVAL